MDNTGWLVTRALLLPTKQIIQKNNASVDSAAEYSTTECLRKKYGVIKAPCLNPNFQT